jgi:hypothetical protein
MARYSEERTFTDGGCAGPASLYGLIRCGGNYLFWRSVGEGFFF